jgi:hypothetical protein
VVVPVDEKGEKIAGQQADYINKDKVERAQVHLQESPAHIQGNHVKYEVTPAYMQEARGNKPVIFLTRQYIPHAERIPVEKSMVLQSLPANKNICQDQDETNYFSVHSALQQYNDRKMEAFLKG